MRHLLLLFSKPATPGRVKTRLAPALGEERAAELHATFVHDAVASLVRGSFDLRLLWALDETLGGALDESDTAGVEPPTHLLPVGARSLDWRRQEGRDLGERLYRALHDAADEAPFVGAVGSDHPEIEAAQVEDAFGRLEAGADVAIGPVPDGGYYLIALRREAVRQRLFDDVPWSTDAVFDVTVERCRELGLELATLPPGHDVDVPADLDALARRLAQRLAFDSDSCPATRALLARWGRLRSADSVPQTR